MEKSWLLTVLWLKTIIFPKNYDLKGPFWRISSLLLPNKPYKGPNIPEFYLLNVNIFMKNQDSYRLKCRWQHSGRRFYLHYRSQSCPNVREKFCQVYLWPFVMDNHALPHLQLLSEYSQLYNISQITWKLFVKVMHGKMPKKFLWGCIYLL